MTGQPNTSETGLKLELAVSRPGFAAGELG